MRSKSIILLLFSIIFSSEYLFSQKFYRIKCDFSIKAKSSEGNSQITIGTVYYDRNIKKLVYTNNFPRNEIWISQDSSVYKIINNKVVSFYKTTPMGEFSIFNLALTSQINNYGLKNSMFTIQNVQKEKDMVITTWVAPKKYEALFGKVLISNKNNRLFGIVFLDKDSKVIRKQFFDKYQNFSGMEFPTEITEIFYSNNKENYQVTTYKNVQIDEPTENDRYDYPIPGASD